MKIISDHLVEKDFNGQPVQMLNHQAELWLPMEAIGDALEYKEPRQSIHKIYERNTDELNDYSCIVSVTTQGGSASSQKRDIRLFNEEGVMILTMLSQQPKAADFRRWAVKILKAYRNQQLTLTNSSPPLHDKFLEKMIVEAGKGNGYAKVVLHDRYGLKPEHRIIECPNCYEKINTGVS